MMHVCTLRAVWKLLYEFQPLNKNKIHPAYGRHLIYWCVRIIAPIPIFYTRCHVSHITCHVSCVMCHVPCFMCHVSCVMCHVSCITCHMSLTQPWTPPYLIPLNAQQDAATVLDKDTNFYFSLQGNFGPILSQFCSFWKQCPINRELGNLFVTFQLDLWRF